MNQIFETVSFHIVKPCNMKCKFCYATFDDFKVGPQMELHDAMKVVGKLADAGVQKITFAGGEPMLYKNIRQIIRFSKSLSLTTSIITNGSLLNDGWLEDMMGSLDWVGISIDSLSPTTNALIGRKAYKEVQYRDLISNIKDRGFLLKINTVVNRFNKSEDFNDFLEWANPDRWKVFQTLRVDGQNSRQFDEISCSAAAFNSFIQRHSDRACLVPENNEAMTGSYLLIDPLGRMFENSSGRHTYSDSLITADVENCLNQIVLNRSRFIARGGIYKW